MLTLEQIKACAEALKKHGDPAGYIGFERVDVGVGVTSDASIGFTPRERESEPLFTIEQFLQALYRCPECHGNGTDEEGTRCATCGVNGACHQKEPPAGTPG